MSDFARLQELAREGGVPIHPPGLVAVPAISPITAAVGDMLNCTMGEWTGEPTGYTYRWQHVDYPVEIGTGDSYTTVTGDAGRSVCCIVTAENAIGTTTATPSNAVAVTAAARTVP